jgi:hypothetical protein
MRTRDVREAPTWFRNAAQWVSLITMPVVVILAIREFSRDRTALGAYVLVLGAVILLSYVRRSRRAADVSPALSGGPREYEFYGFFAAGLLIGTIAFVGAAHPRLAIGAAGFLVAVGSAYGGARGAQNLRREREQASGADSSISR